MPKEIRPDPTADNSSNQPNHQAEDPATAGLCDRLSDRTGD
jgi:hypothetical protein